MRPPEQTGPSSPSQADPAAPARDQYLLDTLVDLGRQVTSVLNLDELLHRIPDLIRRLIDFKAFAVYLLDEQRGSLWLAYGVGYPESAAGLRLGLDQGLVGAAVSDERPVVVNDVESDPRYVECVPGMRAELVIPLRFKGKPIGAINLLGERAGQFTQEDASILSQFAAHVAVALENARLFERQRRHTAVFATMAGIAREMSSILDLDDLLARVAQLARRIIDYRTFGILLLNEGQERLEMKVAIRYDEKIDMPTVKLGEGIVGYAALHKVPVLVADVSLDPRYIKVLDDVRSELAIPMLVKDRCIGVFDLESPELGAFDQFDVDILSTLASQTAVAVENARLYERVFANELRLESELRFAQRVQTALLPTELPVRMRGVDLKARFEPARELGGDFYDFVSPDASHLVIGVGDVSGKGVPAALYGVFANELVRGRSFRRRFVPERSSPAGVLSSINTILHQLKLEEYYCTVCYAAFDFKRRSVVFSNSGLPYPIRFSGGQCSEVELPGVPLGAFPGSEYDEVSFPLEAGDVYVFCTDGIFEAMDESGRDFGAGRLIEVVRRNATLQAAAIVEAIFEAVTFFRGPVPPADDMTAVVLKYSG